jgi:hypothetical protein
VRSRRGASKLRKTSVPIPGAVTFTERMCDIENVQVGIDVKTEGRDLKEHLGPTIISRIPYL